MKPHDQQHGADAERGSAEIAAVRRGVAAVATSVRAAVASCASTCRLESRAQAARRARLATIDAEITRLADERATLRAALAAATESEAQIGVPTADVAAAARAWIAEHGFLDRNEPHRQRLQHLLDAIRKAAPASDGHQGFIELLRKCGREDLARVADDESLAFADSPTLRLSSPPPSAADSLEQLGCGNDSAESGKDEGPSGNEIALANGGDDQLTSDPWALVANSIMVSGDDALLRILFNAAIAQGRQNQAIQHKGAQHPPQDPYAEAPPLPESRGSQGQNGDRAEEQEQQDDSGRSDASHIGDRGVVEDCGSGGAIRGSEGEGGGNDNDSGSIEVGKAATGGGEGVVAHATMVGDKSKRRNGETQRSRAKSADFTEARKSLRNASQAASLKLADFAKIEKPPRKRRRSADVISCSAPANDHESGQLGVRRSARNLSKMAFAEPSLAETPAKAFKRKPSSSSTESQGKATKRKLTPPKPAKASAMAVTPRIKATKSPTNSATAPATMPSAKPVKSPAKSGAAKPAVPRAKKATTPKKQGPADTGVLETGPADTPEQGQASRATPTRKAKTAREMVVENDDQPVVAHEMPQEANRGQSQSASAKRTARRALKSTTVASSLSVDEDENLAGSQSGPSSRAGQRRKAARASLSSVASISLASPPSFDHDNEVIAGSGDDDQYGGNDSADVPHDDESAAPSVDSDCSDVRSTSDVSEATSDHDDESSSEDDDDTRVQRRTKNSKVRNDVRTPETIARNKVIEAWTRIEDGLQVWEENIGQHLEQHPPEGLTAEELSRLGEWNLETRAAGLILPGGRLTGAKWTKLTELAANEDVSHARLEPVYKGLIRVWAQGFWSKGISHGYHSFARRLCENYFSSFWWCPSIKDHGSRWYLSTKLDHFAPLFAAFFLHERGPLSSLKQAAQYFPALAPWLAINAEAILSGTGKVKHICNPLSFTTKQRHYLCSLLSTLDMVSLDHTTFFQLPLPEKHLDAGLRDLGKAYVALQDANADVGAVSGPTTVKQLLLLMAGFPKFASCPSLPFLDQLPVRHFSTYVGHPLFKGNTQQALADVLSEELDSE